MQAIDRATEVRVVEAAARYPDRAIGRRDPLERPVLVERERARSGAWYELFPRSAAHAERHGTFRDAEALLPEVERLGFDVVYLPPIHPIGRTARKGKNNAAKAEPDDVGSPWAIGAREGGHTAVHPELGTLEDFRTPRRARRRARARGGPGPRLPGLARITRGSPSIRSGSSTGPTAPSRRAENPPKRYDDIVNFDFLGAGRDHALAGAARRGPVLARARGAHLPGRQPAHQAPALLGVAAARGARARSGRGVPLRGLHPAEADARPGQARVQPELHLLHLAEPQARAHRVLPGAAPAGVGRCAPPQPLAQHPRHPARVPPARRSPGVPHPGRARRHARRLVRHLLRLRVLRRARCCRARSTATARSTSWSTGGPAAPATSGSGSAGSTESATPSPRSSGTRGCTFWSATTPRSSSMASASRTGPARCWSR